MPVNFASAKLGAVSTSEPVVSVLMITYNHEAYIADAIESVLMQEADFPIRLVIGEDCSTDGTRRICEAYAEQYPEKILLLPSLANLGIQKNFFRTLRACFDSTYTAFCEGDDKWSDKFKLSYQVQFLEKNKQYCAHAHNVTYRDLRIMVDRPFGELIDKKCELIELIQDWTFHCVSLMVKREALESIPFDDLPYFISGDKFLRMWIGCVGDIYYEGRRNMATYHRHASGASENSNFLDVWHQDLPLILFMKRYIRDANVYKIVRTHYIERYFYLLAKSNRKAHKGRIAYACEYVKLTKLANRGNIYFSLVILFGSPFFILQQRLKSWKVARPFS